MTASARSVKAGSANDDACAEAVDTLGNASKEAGHAATEHTCGVEQFAVVRRQIGTNKAIEYGARVSARIHQPAASGSSQQPSTVFWDNRPW